MGSDDCLPKSRRIDRREPARSGDSSQPVLIFAVVGDRLDA